MMIIDGSALPWKQPSETESHTAIRILRRVGAELRECTRDERSASPVEYGIVFCLFAVVIWIVAPLGRFNGLGTYSSVLVSGSSTFGGSFAPTVIIDRAEVLRRSGLKKSTMYKLILRGEFPAQIRLTDGTVGWDSAEVETWIQQRKALRHQGMEAPGIKVQGAGPAQPEGRPMTGWPAPILSERQVTELAGNELSKMRSGDARPFFDKLTGRLWICVLQVDVSDK